MLPGRRRVGDDLVRDRRPGAAPRRRSARPRGPGGPRATQRLDGRPAWWAVWTADSAVPNWPPPIAPGAARDEHPQGLVAGDRAAPPSRWPDERAVVVRRLADDPLGLGRPSPCRHVLAGGVEARPPRARASIRSRAAASGAEPGRASRNAFGGAADRRPAGERPRRASSAPRRSRASPRRPAPGPARPRASPSLIADTASAGAADLEVDEHVRQPALVDDPAHVAVPAERAPASRRSRRPRSTQRLGPLGGGTGGLARRAARGRPRRTAAGGAARRPARTPPTT